jgi:DNA-binding Lrp family transcriptional regulator
MDIRRHADVPRRHKIQNIDAQSRREEDLYAPRRKKSKLDEADLVILKELSANSNILAKEIARQLKERKVYLTERAVRSRIRRLVEHGVIKRFTINVDDEAAGRKVVRLVLVRFRNTGNFINRLGEYMTYVNNSPYCIFASRIRGDLDWMHYKCFPTKALADQEDNIFRSNFGDIMADYRSYDAEIITSKFSSVITVQDVQAYLAQSNKQTKS